MQKYAKLALKGFKGNINTSLFLLQADFHIVDSKSSPLHRIQSIFQRLLSKEEFRYVADLWIERIQFNVDNGNPRKAQDIVYSALRDCPSSKVMLFSFIVSCQRFSLTHSFL